MRLAPGAAAPRPPARRHPPPTRFGRPGGGGRAGRGGWGGLASGPARIAPQSNRLEEVLCPSNARLDLRQLALCRRRSWFRRRFDARLAAVAQRQEPRELPCRRIRVNIPELRIAVVEDTGLIADDYCERHGPPRTLRDICADVVFHPHVAVTHPRPSYRRAFWCAPQRAVTHVPGRHIWREGVERQMGILDRPHRIPRIEADADDVGTGGFHQ